MRASIIEIKNSGLALERLASEYASSLETGLVSDNVIGEVSTVVRAARSALDKAANKMFVESFARKSRNTYFPLANLEVDFARILDINFGPLLRTANPSYAEAIRSCQPFTPEFRSLGKLVGLYRTNTHHGFDLHVVEPSLEISETPDAGPDDQRWATDAASWDGVVVGRKTYLVLPSNSNVHVAMIADWRFEGTSDSVLGTLLEIHNATVKAIGVLGKALDEPVSPNLLASLSKRIRSA